MSPSGNARGLVDIGDNIDDQGPEQSLAGTSCDAWRIPRRLKVVGKSGEVQHGPSDCQIPLVHFMPRSWS